MIFQTEKQLKEFGDKLSAAHKDEIERVLGELREAHSKQDVDAIDGIIDRLNNAWAQASQEMYGNGAQQGQPQGGAGTPGDGGSNAGPSGDGEVTDVDFEEVK